ncbi:hypothetical protein LQ948_11735 [Jiella sp. MQZ9-1]|uniref:Uncharacterized protein n=1 Tax=Jiella flava TaxID=2816857 RepID=A0A939JUL2_9HYPH|nr:hypothetical protein [Jiella flava]MBO0663305.1 hypothetical protein [Jiella flava]MCD2471881.1 hypothetical protein [Jiella flava]
MSETKENIASLMGTKRLADAVRQAKIAAAQRSDVVVDIREADRARLEILAEELQPITREIEPGDDYFDFTVSGGSHPRLWIDGTANVMMARDRRTYRFVRETRLGRLTLAESTEPRTIADHVTEYVAERIVEREKAYAADDFLNGGAVYQHTRAVKVAQDNAEPMRLSQPQQDAVPAKPRRSKGSDFAVALVWLMIGAVLGAGVLLAIASYRGMIIGG